MANIINRQQTFSTNGTVTAAGLHNLIDTALVNSAIIKNQQEITTIGTADLLLIAPDSVDSSLAPRKVTVQNLVDDAFSVGTYTSLNLTGALTYGTATGNRTVSTSATITTGTIPNLTAGTTTSTAATITTGTIPTLTTGTTTSTAEIVTSGTIATLNSTTGTITNLSTTLAGDFTISSGTGTLGTTGVTAGTYGASTVIPQIVVDAKGRVTTVSTSAVSGTEVGSIIAWTTGTAPSGYLHCDGAAINRTTYAALFGVLSTTYGTGDGSTTFNIPDYRGRFLRGFASGQATDPDRSTRTNRGDGTTGDNVGTKQVDEIKSHNHTAPATFNFVTQKAGVGPNDYPAGAQLQAQNATALSGGNETRPTNIYVMWCVKF
jgi:microcystin-dependent protein